MQSMQAQAVGPGSTGEEVRIDDLIDEAYDAWKEAEDAARLLQRAVADAWQRYERRVGGPPSRDLLAEAAWLRNAARERLADAVVLLVQAGHIQPAGERKRPARMAVTSQ